MTINGTRRTDATLNASVSEDLLKILVQHQSTPNDNPLGQVTSVVEEYVDDQIFFIELTGNTVVPSFTVEEDGDDQVFYINA